MLLLVAAEAQQSAQIQSSTAAGPMLWMLVVAVALLLVVFTIVIFVRGYKRCPSNRILVVFGRVGDGQSAKCLHGGGTFVVPLIQDYAYLSLDPIVVEISLKDAMAQDSTRVQLSGTFTVGISTDPSFVNRAAERLLNLPVETIRQQAGDIIADQLRRILASQPLEEFLKKPSLFMAQIDEHVERELNVVGLEVINCNIRSLRQA